MKNKNLLIYGGIALAAYYLLKGNKSVSGIGRITSSGNAAIKQYILDAIDADGYGEHPKSDREKLMFLDRTFRSEYGFNIKRIGYVRAFSEWMQGLPSSFNIDYENYRIIELAKEWGSIPYNATERQEDKIINNWFNFIANKTIMLMRKNKISTY